MNSSIQPILVEYLLCVWCYCVLRTTPDSMDHLIHPLWQVPKMQKWTHPQMAHSQHYILTFYFTSFPVLCSQSLNLQSHTCQKFSIAQKPHIWKKNYYVIKNGGQEEESIIKQFVTIIFTFHHRVWCVYCDTQMLCFCKCFLVMYKRRIN